MKKKVFSMLMIGVIVASCQKVELSDTTPIESSLNQLNELSISYINSHRTAGDQDRLSDRWKRILSRDCTGALAGGATGAAAGALGGPEGVVVGAIIGGILGGAAASLDAAIGEGGMAPGGPIGFWDPIYHIEMLDLTGNTDNPYDYIGLHHYFTIHNYALGLEGDISDDLYPFYLEGSTYLEGEFDYAVESIFRFDDVESIVEGTIGIEDMETEIQALYETEQISSTVHSILIAYCEVYDITTQRDIEDFILYSISAENMVSADPEISDLDKRLILGTMSTARYGAQYWNFFIAE